MLKGRYLASEILEDNDRFVLARGIRLEKDAQGNTIPAGEILVRILKDTQSRPEVLERYTRELQVTSLLVDHPLVLRYHDVDLIGNRYCVITDHVPHPSLERLLLARTRLSYPVVLTVMKALVSLLSAAQANGMVERQIHLEDLLVNPANGDLKLVKFSTPRSLTVKGHVQRRAGVVSTIGDAYFLGCTLFRLLTLEHAYSSLQNSEVIAAARFADGVKSAHPSIGASEIERLILMFTRLTTRELANHFDSLDAVADELDELEGLNADITKARRHADMFARRAKRNKLTETAFDTVAAFSGKLQAPREEPPPPTPRRVARTTPRVPQATRLAREEHQALSEAAAEAEALAPEAPTPPPQARQAARVQAAQDAAMAAAATELDPQMKGASTLLWGRYRDQDSAGALNWDDPLVMRMVMMGGVAMFFAMLLGLLFGH